MVLENILKALKYVDISADLLADLVQILINEHALAASLSRGRVDRRGARGGGMVVSLLRTLRSHYENVILELRPNVLIVAI